jgi:hypothetical protein
MHGLQWDYSFPGHHKVSIIIRVAKSRRMRWAVHVADMGEMRNAVQYFGLKT